MTMPGPADGPLGLTAGAKQDSKSRSRRERNGHREGARSHCRLVRAPELNTGPSWSFRDHSATPGRPVRKSGTEGSNPLSSGTESVHGKSPIPCEPDFLSLASAWRNSNQAGSQGADRRTASIGAGAGRGEPTRWMADPTGLQRVCAAAIQCQLCRLRRPSVHDAQQVTCEHNHLDRLSRIDRYVAMAMRVFVGADSARK